MKKQTAATMAMILAFSGTTISVAPAEAATDYKAAVAVDFRGATWENGNPGDYSSNISVGFDKTNPSKNLSISFDAYIPTALFTNEDSMLEIDPSLWVRDEEHEYGNINLANHTEIDISKAGDGFEARLWYQQEERAETTRLSATVSGDYVAVSATDIKLDSRYTGWNDAGEETYSEIDESVSAWVNPSFNFLANGITGTGIVYIDNVILKNGTGIINQTDFNSTDILYDTFNWSSGNKEGVAPVEFVSSQTQKDSKTVKQTLTLKKSSGTVKVGKTLKIKATAKPSAKITYKSSNKKVATVTSKGVSKGIKKGKATITVKANGVTKKFKVTVKK